MALSGQAAGISHSMCPLAVARQRHYTTSTSLHNIHTKEQTPTHLDHSSCGWAAESLVIEQETLVLNPEVAAEETAVKDGDAEKKGPNLRLV